jgi:hypothetical protein
MLHKNVRRNFSYIYHNLPSVPNYNLNGKNIILDEDISNYNKFIREFLTKKWLTKSEIPPIIKSIPISQKDILSYQKVLKRTPMVPLDEDILRYQYEKGFINRNYLFNILFEKNEIDLNRAILSRIVMSGYCVKYFDCQDFQELTENRQKVENLVKVFYLGQNLTDQEKAIQAIYLTYKYNKWRERKKFALFTNSDLAKSMNVNYFIEELTKNRLIKPNWEGFNYKNILDAWHLMRTQGGGFAEKWIYLTLRNDHLSNYMYKINLVSKAIITKISIWLNSEEFNKQFDSELNFYISHALLSMHIWMICQRLNNFKRSKPAQELVRNILKLSNKLSNNEFQKVDTLRRISKFKTIEENYEDQKKMFHWHFNILNPTADNNFFKIDALVWTYVFREKIPRYDDRIYKMSHYLISHFHYFKQLSYFDIENMNFQFDLSCIPYNYKDNILKYNPALTNEIFLREKYSDFQYKLYSYSYKTEEERDPDQMKKTYIRYDYHSTFDKKNFLMRSKRKEDSEYDELQDSEMNEEMERILNPAKNPLFNTFESLANREFGRSNDICEMEDRRRIKEDYNDEYIRNIKIQTQEEPILKDRFSNQLRNYKKNILYTYRHSLKNNPQAEKDFFHHRESKMFYPEANVVLTRSKKKSFAEKLFKL